MDHDPDILISRIVDGEATFEDWAALKALADADSSLWFHLAQAQMDHQRLVSGLGAAIAIADSIDAPSEAASVLRFSRRFGRVGTWGGWAAAALVGLAIVLRAPVQTPSGNTAGISLTDSAADAYDRYLDLGRREGGVLGEVPERYLIQSSPRPDGSGYELIYVKQILERRVVPDLYKIGTDELGRPSPVRVEIRLRGEPM